MLCFSYLTLRTKTNNGYVYIIVTNSYPYHLVSSQIDHFSQVLSYHSSNKLCVLSCLFTSFYVERKEFTCELCGDRFSRQVAMTRHMITTHAGNETVFEFLFTYYAYSIVYSN